MRKLGGCDRNDLDNYLSRLSTADLLAHQMQALISLRVGGNYFIELEDTQIMVASPNEVDWLFQDRLSAAINKRLGSV